MTEIIVTQSVFINKSLQSATNRIMKIGETVRKCAFETAFIMAKVDENECYKDDGFNSVHEWAMTTFGFKKSVSYTLLRVGKEYTRAITDGNGKIKGFGSNLVPAESPEDFTTSQIEKMLPLDYDDAAELVDSRVITPEMTCKEIAEVVKARRHGESEATIEGEATDKSKNDTLAAFNGSESEEVTLHFTIDRELGTAVLVDPDGVCTRFDLAHLGKFIELVRQTGEVIK